MAIPFYAGIALGHIGRHSQRRHGLCRPPKHIYDFGKFQIAAKYNVEMKMTFF